MFSTNHMKSGAKLGWYFTRMGRWAYTRYGNTLDSNALAYCKEKLQNDIVNVKIKLVDQLIQVVEKKPRNNVFDYLGIVGEIIHLKIRK